MMRALRHLLFCVVAVVLVGCQSVLPISLASQASIAPVKGVTSSAADTRPRGFLQLAIRWPTAAEQRERGYRSQLIPDSAAKMDVRVYDGVTEVGNALNVTRTAGSLTNVTIELRAKNNLSVDVKVYPASPDQGTQIASGNATGVNIYSSANTSVTLTLVPDYVPTITNLNFSAGAVGQSVTLTGTNFKKSWGATPRVWFNATVTNGVPTGVETAPTTSSDTSITVAVPPGAKTGNIVVEADNVPSASTANYYVISSLAITAANVTINGHTTGNDGLVAGMVYYGNTLDFIAVGTFEMASGETLTGTWTNPPAPTWTSANANHTIATNSGPTAGSNTTTTVGRMQAAATNQTGNISATIGSVTSNAILAQSVGVNSISISPSSVTINAMPPTGTAVSATYLAQTTATLTATVNSSLPFTDGVTWSFGALVATTNNTTTLTIKTADGAAAGSATVTATSVTTNGITAQRTVTITDFGDLVLGIQ